VVEKGGGGGTNDLETGVIVDNESVVELVVSTRDKDREDKERDKKIAKLDLELRAFQRKLKGIAPDKQVDKDKIKIKMMEITDKMQDLRDEKMDDQKFWGMLAMDDDDDAFDYGRDILKDGTYENHIKLPYEQLPLFTQADWFEGSI
jgi:membrane protein involved in colicin uptake